MASLILLEYNNIVMDHSEKIKQFLHNDKQDELIFYTPRDDKLTLRKLDKGNIVHILCEVTSIKSAIILIYNKATCQSANLPIDLLDSIMSTITNGCTLTFLPPRTI
jgi:hypothetical protein